MNRFTLYINIITWNGSFSVVSETAQRVLPNIMTLLGVTIRQLTQATSIFRRQPLPQPLKTLYVDGERVGSLHKVCCICVLISGRCNMCYIKKNVCWNPATLNVSSFKIMASAPCKNIEWYFCCAHILRSNFCERYSGCHIGQHAMCPSGACNTRCDSVLLYNTRYIGHNSIWSGHVITCVMLLNIKMHIIKLNLHILKVLLL